MMYCEESSYDYIFIYLDSQSPNHIYNSLVFFPYGVDAYTTNHNLFDATRERQTSLSRLFFEWECTRQAHCVVFRGLVSCEATLKPGRLSAILFCASSPSSLSQALRLRLQQRQKQKGVAQVVVVLVMEQATPSPLIIEYIYTALLTR